MSSADYTFAYAFEIVCLGLFMAVLKNSLDITLEYLSLLMRKLRIKLLDKILFHLSDSLFVFTFFITYLLLSYVRANGVLRIIDICIGLISYFIGKFTFRFVFEFLNNILRQIVNKIVIRPIRYLHNKLILVITRIIRLQMSK